MKKISLLFLFFHLGVSAQNWNPFNYAYRYNYILNNAAFVTNVLFADSFDVTASDSTLYLNRIAVPCNGTCLTTTVTVPQGKYYLVKNIPQAMQRKISKKANGWLRFLDTANINISPSLALNQPWLCDTANAINAKLTSLGTRTVFGAVDSVRVYLIGTADTLVISKNHGILVFPLPYNKNKFYRLQGIERNHYYDSVSVAGYKVPNAWDIYNYQVGDVFCYTQDGYDKMTLIPEYFNGKEQITITSKSISATGYTYGYDKYRENYKSTSLFNPPQLYLSANTSFTMFCATTATFYCMENTLYPGAVVKGAVPVYARDFNAGYNIRNIGNFGLAANNRFCKFFGAGTMSGLPSSADNSCVLDVPNTSGQIMERNYFRSTLHFLPTFGMVSSSFSIEEGNCKTTLSCFERNGVSIFGPKFFGITEFENDLAVSIYPNPAKEQVYIESPGQVNLIFYDALGRNVKQAHCESNMQLRIDDLANGLYFVEIQANVGKAKMQKVLVAR